MKVYTRTGDKGMTSLFDGTRINKDDIRIESYGTVDELNSHIGHLISYTKEDAILSILIKTQSILFDIGSHLASDNKLAKFLPVLNEDEIERLEIEMDNYNDNLPELKTFILPRGNTRIASAHICRTVCRRAERRVVSLSRASEVPEFIIRYLNRLSDYFFVLARYLTQLDGIDEKKWLSK